ncbi:hypothetical protein MMC11_008212 [Xylographa trunciseda]|nr:hypothetical protein [Xylographa trunciseda]
MTSEVARSRHHHGSNKRRKSVNAAGRPLLLDDTIVTVIAGKGKRVFKIHQNLLCSASDYFKAALEGKFKEAEEKRIEFLEESSKVIERFQLWLYSGSILEHMESWIYFFAKIRLITKLENDVIDVLIRQQQKSNLCFQSEFMFKETMKGSAIRKFCVDTMVRRGNLREWDLERTYPPCSHGFLIEVILELALEKDRSREEREHNFWEIRCDYHVHAKDEPRCSRYTPIPDQEDDSSTDAESDSDSSDDSDTESDSSSDDVGAPKETEQLSTKSLIGVSAKVVSQTVIFECDEG